MGTITDWAKHPPPMTPKQTGARMKKMYEHRAMAKGREVKPSYDPDLPEWARVPDSLDGFRSSLTPLHESRYRIGWLSRLLQYVRNEFAQFVSIIGGYTPFQYYAGPYSPWDKNIHYSLIYYGGGGYAPASLKMTLNREYVTSEGAFHVGHAVSWSTPKQGDQESFYALFISVYTEDFYLQSSWETQGDMRFAFRPSDHKWLPDGMEYAVSCGYEAALDKIEWGIDLQYRAEHSHWAIRYSPQTFHINFYAGLIRGLSGGLAYTYNHKFGVSAWSASGYYEYAADAQDEDETGTSGWGFALDLNPHGGFHTTLALDRAIPIPGQPVFLAAAYSFSYGGDDIATGWHAGIRTTVPVWIPDIFGKKPPDEQLLIDEEHEDRHNIATGGLALKDKRSEKDWPGEEIEPTQAVIALSASSRGFFGWRFSFQPLSYHANDNIDNPYYPIAVGMQLDVGFWTGMLSPIIHIGSEY